MFSLGRMDVLSTQLEMGPVVKELLKEEKTYLGVLGAKIRKEIKKQVRLNRIGSGWVVTDINDINQFMPVLSLYEPVCEFVINPSAYPKELTLLDSSSVEGVLRLIGLTKTETVEELVLELIESIRLEGRWETVYHKTEYGLQVTFQDRGNVTGIIQINLDEEIMNQFSVIERIQ